jgi:hypothetical protein
MAFLFDIPQRESPDIPSRKSEMIGGAGDVSLAYQHSAASAYYIE